MKNLWNIKGSHLMVVRNQYPLAYSLFQNRHKTHRRCTFIHSNHNWKHLKHRPLFTSISVRTGLLFWIYTVCARYLSLTTSPRAKIIVFWYFTIKRQILTVPIPSIRLLVSKGSTYETKTVFWTHMLSNLFLLKVDVLFWVSSHLTW